MVRAKMGALALTALMGLGAAGSMKVFAETDVQNVSAINFAKQEMADEHTMVETSEGFFEWTQEMTDRCLAEYEQTLENIKNGLLVSKSVDGDDECMTTFNHDWVGSTVD